jgi:hydroxymethylbilane synthase
MAAHRFSEAQVPITVIKTSGDRIQDRPLSEVGGKGLFTKEIEEALLAREVDLAVHSMKDLETKLPAGLALASVLEREDVRDAFISLKHKSLAELPAGAVIGTSSLRRRAAVLRLRPDVRIVEFRGNVETRLGKLEAGVADATLLACAGLNRLGQSHRITAPIEVGEILPAVAQGAVGIEIRSDDARTAELVAALNHRPTALCVEAERAFLARLDGSCRTPIAALARLAGQVLTIEGMLLATDGSAAWSASRRGTTSDAVRLAVDAAEEVLSSARA